MTPDCIPLLIMSCLAFTTVVLTAALSTLGLFSLAAGRDTIWECRWQLSSPAGGRSVVASIAVYVARGLLRVLATTIRAVLRICLAALVSSRPDLAGTSRTSRRSIMPVNATGRVAPPRHYQPLGERLRAERELRLVRRSAA